MSSAHLDTFARDHLPPREEWPEFVFDLPELVFPERQNAAEELLDRAVFERGWGDRPAIRSARETLTYRALLERANRIARVLTEDLGLVPGNRVLLHGPNNAGTAAAWFGIVKAGGIVVATMPLLRARELATILQISQASHALVDATVAAELELARPEAPALRSVVYFHHDGPESLEARCAGKPTDFANVDTSAEDVAILAFTSGTTGKPKGTMHFHRDLLAACRCFPPHVLRPTPEDVFCGTPPLAFTFGLGGLLLFPLAIGATTVLVEKLTPELLLETIDRYQATVCFTAPTFYRMMAAIPPKHDLSSLRKCVSAGEALPVPTREAWQTKTGLTILDGIGSTELLHMFIAHTEEEVRPGATGKPIPGYRARVVDEHGEPVPAGTVGRLAVQGPTGCRYLADPRQRQYVQDGWNFTGDAYKVDEDGYFHYQARTDDMIISAGYNIAGPEVEDVLLAHPAVAECGVVGLPDEERGQVVAAFVVLRPDHEAGPERTRELQEWVKARIAPYKYPRVVFYRQTLPRTLTGKLQRFQLREETMP
ncbi:MAG: AMP-binding protein [Thermoanaerobaculia bacterium]|nr:AMP-binding protein [Thermoanaerobaculia bacterium]